MSSSASDRWAADGRPKRILGLDGGGVRGILSLCVLERMEALLRERPGRSGLVLADHFDLVSGTSTGAVIAAGIARGMNVESLVRLYREPAGRIFEKGLFRRGLVRASTAAPSYFEPEGIEIRSAVSDRPAEKGLFVDGDVSPHDNPALQAVVGSRE